MRFLWTARLPLFELRALILLLLLLLLRSRLLLKIKAIESLINTGWNIGSRDEASLISSYQIMSFDEIITVSSFAMMLLGALPLPQRPARSPTPVLRGLPSPPLPPSQLLLSHEIGGGSYGAVYDARCLIGEREVDAIAKCARASDSADMVLAEAYLSIEDLVYETIEERRREGDLLPGFCSYLGKVSAHDDEWLLWERLPPCRGLQRAISLSELNQETGPEAGRESVDQAFLGLSLGTFGLTAPGVLRDVCVMVQQLHESGFVHRDVKTANLLLAGSREGEGASLYLIDMGSCAQVKISGCTHCSYRIPSHPWHRTHLIALTPCHPALCCFLLPHRLR